MTKEEKKEAHKVKMIVKRAKQKARKPDLDAALVYFSRNSFPEYRKPFVKEMKK